MKKMILFLLVLLMTAATGTWAQTTHTVKMKSGTKDAANWTIATGSEPNVRTATGDATEGLTGVAKGDEVRLTYSGRLKVKSVTATHDGWNGDLSNIPASAIASDGLTVTVPDGTTLTGTFNGYTQPYKITIADGATVTLADVIIKASGDESTKWAGIICAGDATIIVKDGTYNDVYAMYEGYPAIYIPGDANNSSNNKTLTIKGGTAGTGQLRANGGVGAAGIGGGKEIDCGNIIIEGGKITANGTANGGAAIGAGPSACCGNITITGGDIFASGETNTPGIGSGYDDSICGKIIIFGGTVKAVGGDYAPAIGSGCDGSICGDILITTGVTNVTASKSIDDTVYCIGPGMNSYCGTVRIGCTLDNNGNPVGGSNGYKTDYYFSYQPSH